MTICLADRRRLAFERTDLVRAVVRQDETKAAGEPASIFHGHAIDGTLPTSTCDDGELELYASEMGVLSKAKLAAKRLALKGVKSIRELPLGEAEAAARKPILVSRTKEIRSPGKRDERRGNRK
jgi:hypothetical protein